MGAIVAEELKKSEVMAGREEKILVLVRLRPLNEKEISKNEVADWECINQSTILYRNSLQERSGLPTAYSFDRVYSGDCSSKQVYEEGTKEIALSVVSGINSSIFAYGQTSSGKTYTMNAITEFTVADIYDYIQRHEERAFALKFSAMEIYNENVRDLLSSDNTPLRLMDDPEKGTIVEKLTEEKLNDWGHLKKLLAICEAQRKIGETSLNEQSSRSHQILKLTIESSAREFIGKGNSSTLSASVFFIDLAGSERASQAMSAGTRLKEGCHINRSLLTLGNVIRKLSNGRQGHINYRDSKLTRILQPCLGGNARTTIICTLSPARIHVEQSRNTLLFASCAKEVTTNAQVNVVMSDKALVKHLQKELARLENELRSPAPTSSSCHCSVIIRKKDLQLEKMEKEIRELTKQRDLAQSRVEDLLQIIGNDQSSNKQQRHKHHPKWKLQDKWEDEGSISDSSVNGVQDEDGESYIEDPSSRGLKHEEECTSDDQCREVRCIEMEGSEASGNGHVVDHGSIGRSSHQNGFMYDSLEQRIQEVQRSIDSLVSPQPENPSIWDGAADASSSKSLNYFNKTRNPKANFTNGGSFPTSNEEEYSERTPPSEVESEFTGRPGGLRKLAVIDYGVNSGKLSREGSQSSVGTEIVDDVRSQSGNNVAEEEITSVQTFVAGLKDAKLQYEKQFGDSQVPSEMRKTLRDVGLDPMLDGEATTLDWRLQFEKLQKAIIELWQTCNVSLVHRTYFFLLFTGDPTDSIYLEVELRRLTFLKDTFSHGNRSVDGGHAQKLVSSEKAIRKEKEALSKLINKRFSSKERKKLYSNWGIKLDSKRRRLQLVSQLWADTENMDHVSESAAIISKLVKFSEQGKALKGMFGLSFSPPSLRRRSYGWMNSRASSFVSL
ncbi:kinesin-like protein KIN-7F [Beta vulgaris subsp. vulgaris]|uniref:kinesin-like protein KIN-7F n=1 Tax=Beta vulgaris subsp. vulgaris TaxID=3555 RepID=UPI0020375202|nr:kinesin-like protein KIN-7F [Beta vulgaris subsp. vulgaris]XP_010690758.2 kinesin-like protein KIN-7F [Beta vulgaris subsp. vulgaris]XP_048492337.1 kinesin-like protein KIN-7F [Beta vulgaris subsp. vulgaris]